MNENENGKIKEDNNNPPPPPPSNLTTATESTSDTSNGVTQAAEEATSEPETVSETSSDHGTVVEEENLPPVEDIVAEGSGTSGITDDSNAEEFVEISTEEAEIIKIKERLKNLSKEQEKSEESIDMPFNGYR